MCIRDRLRPYHLAANARQAPAKDDEKPGVQRFSFDEGVQLAVDLPLCKAALGILSAIWPASITWDALVERCLLYTSRCV